MTSLSGCLLYFFWLVIGIFLLGGCLILLLGRPPWTLSWIDVVYWSTFVAMHLARSLQNGPPAGDAAIPPLTTAQWRLRLTVVATVLWVVAQCVQVWQ
jgi:hypothetical protein